MSNVRSIRRRMSLLATSSAFTMGLALSAGALTALSPTAALAQCGAPAGGAVTCAPGNYPTGIAYATVTPLTVSLAQTPTTAVTTTTGGVTISDTVPGDTLILQRTFSGTPAAGSTAPSLVNLTGPAISVTGLGPITVDLTAPTTDTGIVVSGSSNGIVASSTSTTAPVAVILTTGTVSGGTAYGIDAAANGGGLTINTGTASINGATGAIYATQFGGAGAISVTANGPLTATGGDAVTAAISNAGNGSTVQVTVGGLVTATGNGVVASTMGTGSVNINQTAGDIEPGTGNGMTATSTSGAITITQADSIGAAGPVGISAPGNDGISATSTSGPITITANSINTSGEAITVTSASGAVVVNTTAGGLVQAAGDGIAVTTGGAGSISVNVHGNITGDTNAGGFGDGITLTSGAGAIVVNTDVGTTIQALAAPQSINITSGSGNVTVLSHSAINTPSGDAIDVTTGGSGVINVTSAGRITGGGAGVTATSIGTGAVSVTNTGTIGSSLTHIGGNGVVGQINDIASNATVTVSDIASVYANGVYGVAAINRGTGAAVVSMGSGTALAPLTIDPSMYGVYSYSAGGPALATAGAYNTYIVGAAGTANNAGLFAQSGEASDPSVGVHTAAASLGANDVITVAGNDSAGVYADNFSGPAGAGTVSVTTGAADAITVSGSRSGGIYAATNGVGGVNVTTGTGTITVNEVGVIGSGVTPRNYGIDAESTGGPVVVGNASTISVTASLTDTSYGIFAATDGAGTVAVTSSGAITTNGFGIATLTTTGANTVNVTGNVTGGTGAASTAPGIDASASTGPVSVTVGAASTVTGGLGVVVSGSGTTTVTNSGDIVGLNTTVGDAVEFESSGAETLNNNTGGTLTSPGVATNSATVYANNIGGTLTINNAGTINSTQANHLGVVIGVVGTGGLTVNNTGTIDGRLTTANGHVAFTNYNTWTTNGPSTFGSLASAATNTLTNSGTVAVGLTGTNAAPAASTSTTTFTNLGAFNNSGRVTLQNGLPGDNLTTTGTYAGSGNATLAIDLKATTPTPVLDTLTIGGAATGSTQVAINIVGGAPGLVNGATVVNASAAGSSASAFAVAPYSANQGFIHYGIVYNGAGGYLLYGTPNGAAYETAMLGEQQHNLWYVTQEAWSDHLTELRDAASAGDGSLKDGVHSWAIFNGGESDRNANRSFTAFGQTSNYNIGYKQDYLSGEIGVDTVSSFGGGQTVWGVTAGYAQGNSDFNSTGDEAKDEVYNVGLYAGWVSGGLFINGLVKYDGGTMNLNGLYPGYTTSQNLSELGGTIELGYRFGSTWWFEPVGSISYVAGQSHDFSALGSTFHFSDDDSSRGKLGILTGTTVPIMDGAKLVPYAGVNAVDEFMGQDHVTFTNAGQTLVFNNHRPSTFGQGDVGVDLIAANGFTSFFQAHGDFGGDMSGYGARIGVRWRW
jgi:outer membrane autotransporter protein